MSGNDNNNTGEAKNNMPSLTINDLAAMIQQQATKRDIEQLIAHRLDTHEKKTNEKIHEIQQQVDTVAELHNENADQIEELQATVESLRQEQLKNNICISGVPPQQIIDGNTHDIIVKIASVLGVSLQANNFVAYPVAEKKFIIVKFNSYNYKHQLLMKIRARKSLTVEEVFGIKSNSQIYLNDHLTPHNNKLHIHARNAKKDEKLATVSSQGGVIRVRKNINEKPITIINMQQLNSIIESGDVNHTDSQNQPAVDEPNTNENQTQQITNENKEKNTEQNKSEKKTPAQNRLAAKAHKTPSARSVRRNSGSNSSSSNSKDKRATTRKRKNSTERDLEPEQQPTKQTKTTQPKDTVTANANNANAPTPASPIQID